MTREDDRQIFHMLMGASAMAAVALFGTEIAAYAIGAVLLCGLVLVHLKLSGTRLGALEPFVDRFERPGVTPGYGAMTMAAGALAITTLIANPNNVLASLFILGAGDAASTIVGTRCKMKLPHNRKKTCGGTLAFFLASLPAVFIAGAPAVVVAALAALAESLESDIDDNLAIAIACVIGFGLLG